MLNCSIVHFIGSLAVEEVRRRIEYGAILNGFSNYFSGFLFHNRETLY
jgi:hypothetical protein